MCMFTCMQMTPEARRGLDPIDLQLEASVSYPAWGLGFPLSSSVRAAFALNH